MGAVESWTPTLRMMVGLVLANRLQMVLWWGPSFCQIYNDASWPALGVKHPRSMGQLASEFWPEVWHIIGPVDRVAVPGWPGDLDGGHLPRNESKRIHRGNALDDRLQPVFDDDEPSGIGGVIATLNEITENVVGERRVVALRNLGARSAEAKTAEEAWTIAAETLGHHPEDVPFALLYLVRGDRKRARLAGASGAAAGGLDSPTEIASKIRSRCAGSSPEPESRIQTLGETFQFTVPFAVPIQS